MFKKLKLSALALVFAIAAQAQNKSLQVGLKLINDLNTDGGGVSPGVGGQLVYRMTKHSGLESGLFYYTQTNTFYNYFSSSSYYVQIVESWLSLPVLYRFDSRIVNFVAGPQIDYFLGWRNKQSSPSLIVNSYSRSNARIGLSGGLSKTIHLSPKWLLEPEAKLLYYPAEERSSVGLNIALRRRLF